MLGKKRVTTVWLVINSDCNNNCDFCYYVNRDSSVMSFENIKKYKKLIDKLNPSKLILIGGEPTIHKDFLRILKLFSKRKYKLSVVSNGTTLINPDFCKIVLNSVNNITLSVQGYKKIHNKVVNNNFAFQNIVKSIKNINLINKKMLNTNTVITKESIVHIKKIVRVLHNLGVRKFGFNICTSFDKNLFSFNQNNFIKLFESKLRFLIKKYPDCSFKVVTPIMKCLIKEDLRKYFNYGCHIFYGSGLIINPDNEILLCTHWTEKPIAKIDPSISIKQFNSLWQELDSTRNIISRRPYKKCNSCIYKNSCFGGCPVFWQ